MSRFVALVSAFLLTWVVAARADGLPAADQAGFDRSCGTVAEASLEAFSEGDGAAMEDFVHRLTHDVGACDPSQDLIPRPRPENSASCVNACLRGLKSGVLEDLRGTFGALTSVAKFVATHFIIGPMGLPIPAVSTLLETGKFAADLGRRVRDNPKGVEWLSHCLNPSYSGRPGDLDRALSYAGTDGAAFSPNQLLCEVELMDAVRAHISAIGQRTTGIARKRLNEYRCMNPEAREELACEADGVLGAELAMAIASEGLGEALELFKGGAAAEAVVARAMEKDSGRILQRLDERIPEVAPAQLLERPIGGTPFSAAELVEWQKTYPQTIEFFNTTAPPADAITEATRAYRYSPREDGLGGNGSTYWQTGRPSSAHSADYLIESTVGELRGQGAEIRMDPLDLDNGPGSHAIVAANKRPWTEVPGIRRKVMGFDRSGTIPVFEGQVVLDGHPVDFVWFDRTDRLQSNPHFPN